jgi:hypothetical protein
MNPEQFQNALPQEVSFATAFGGFTTFTRELIADGGHRCVCEVDGGRRPSLTQEDVAALGIDYAIHAISESELNRLPQERIADVGAPSIELPSSTWPSPERLPRTCQMRSRCIATSVRLSQAGRADPALLSHLVLTGFRSRPLCPRPGCHIAFSVGLHHARYRSAPPTTRSASRRCRVKFMSYAQSAGRSRSTTSSTARTISTVFRASEAPAADSDSALWRAKAQSLLGLRTCCSTGQSVPINPHQRAKCAQVTTGAVLFRDVLSSLRNVHGTRHISNRKVLLMLTPVSLI